MTQIDSEDQWQAWRIGRDAREAGDTLEAAVSRLEGVFPQAGQKQFFMAGFAGNSCPMLTAQNPE